MPRPVMEQYLEIKAANPDCLLFYRMGDFYELFFEDAEIAARALGIVLTKRGKHLGRDIPMCGVPVHRADEYLHRLIALGHRVAVCEQIEDPAEARKRGAKSVVRRNVTRLVTPGTLTEDTLLDARRNNYLLAIARARASADEASRFALAWIDISTGEFRIAECDRAGLAAEVARLEPGEVIVSDALYGDAEIAPWLRTLPAVMPLARDVFDGATAERRLAAYFGLATTEGLGALSRLELTAAAACVSYVERTQLGRRPPLSPPLREAARRDTVDRSGHPQQSRAHAYAGGGAPRLAACGDRSHGDRRRLAAGCPAACRAAHRPRRDRAPPRCRRVLRDRRGGSAPSCARAWRPRPISPARWRGWWSAAAAPATSPPFATASPPRPRSRASFERPAGFPRSSAEAAQALRRPDAGDRRRADARARRRASASATRRRLRTRGLRRRRSTRRARCATNPAA